MMDVLFWLLPVAKTHAIHIKKRTSLFWLHSGGFSLWLGGLVAFSVVGRSHGREHVIGTCAGCSGICDTVLGIKMGRCLEPTGLPLLTTVSFRFSVKSVFQK